MKIRNELHISLGLMETQEVFNEHHFDYELSHLQRGSFFVI